jgi:hypothetical protein
MHGQPETWYGHCLCVLNSDDSAAVLGSEEGRGGGGVRRDLVQPRRQAAGLCAGHHLGARRGNWPPAGRPHLSS